jgi:hypothetical protein
LVRVGPVDGRLEIHLKGAPLLLCGELREERELLRREQITLSGEKGKGDAR